MTKKALIKPDGAKEMKNLVSATKIFIEKFNPIFLF